MKNSLLLIFLIFIFSCKNKSNNINNNIAKNDTLVYSIKTDSAKSKSFVSREGEKVYSYAKATYPIFEDCQELNNIILVHLIASDNPDAKPVSSVQENLTGFMNEYDMQYNQSVVSGSEPPFTTYEKDYTISLLNQNSNYICLALEYYSYSGSAHGLGGTHFINYDIKNKREIKIDDLFIAGNDSSLTKIAEQIFRKQENLTQNDLLKNYFFDEDKFALNQNFTIADSGLVFLYNQYEIKSYAEGITELAIPYSAIKRLVKPNSIIATKIN